MQIIKQTQMAKSLDIALETNFITKDLKKTKPLRNMSSNPYSCIN